MDEQQNYQQEALQQSLEYQQYYQEQQRLHYRKIRRDYNIQGLVLLIYMMIMNEIVSIFMVIGAVPSIISQILSGQLSDIEQFVDQILNDCMSMAGWGYLMAILVGTAILMLWKKPKYVFGTLWTRGKPMKVGSFFGILSVFISAQLIFMLISLLMDWLGINLTDPTQDMISMDDLGMFLYVGLGAPISEEILFRGLVLRSMEPHGKKFAIFASSLLFGLYHGNLSQAPFAFLVGLVLAYVTLEYNIGWAMVLHMFNNLLLSDSLSRLSTYLPAPFGDLLVWAVIVGFSIAAVVVLIVKRKSIKAYLRSEVMNPMCPKAFFRAPGIIILLVVLTITIATTTLSMFFM